MTITRPANKVIVTELMLGFKMRINPQTIDNIVIINADIQEVFVYDLKEKVRRNFKILLKINQIPKVEGIIIVRVFGYINISIPDNRDIIPGKIVSNIIILLLVLISNIIKKIPLVIRIMPRIMAHIFREVLGYIIIIIPHIDIRTEIIIDELIKVFNFFNIYITLLSS
jgi:hypothetical protein